MIPFGEISCLVRLRRKHAPESHCDSQRIHLLLLSHLWWGKAWDPTYVKISLLSGNFKSSRNGGKIQRGLGKHSWHSTECLTIASGQKFNNGGIAISGLLSSKTVHRLDCFCCLLSLGSYLCPELGPCPQISHRFSIAHEILNILTIYKSSFKNLFHELPSLAYLISALPTHPATCTSIHPYHALCL